MMARSRDLRPYRPAGSAGWALVTALAGEGLNTFTVPVTSLVVVVLLAALAGVVAAVLPARRAARLDVLRAIASE